ADQNIVTRDIGKAKVLVQARRLLEIRPNLKVQAIHSPLEFVPMSVYRADLILACLDSRIARQVVNERAWHMGGTVWADSGVLGSEWLARVNVYTPAADAPCLECAWSDEDYRLLEQHYLCRGASGPAPTGATAELGALAAAMLAAECRKILT